MKSKRSFGFAYSATKPVCLGRVQPFNDTVDGSFEIRRSPPPGMVLKPIVNNGINYQPQLVQDFNFSHQQ